MKKLKVLLAVATLLITFSFASAQKLAHVYVEEILKVMPDKIKADEQLNAFANGKKAEIQKQITAAETTVKKYQAEAPKQTAAINEARSKEIQKLQQNIQELNTVAEKDLNQKQEIAYAPIQKKLIEALQKVATDKGYDYIFDANSTTIVYKNGPDATADVKKVLGL